MAVLKDADIVSRFVLSNGAYIDEHFVKYTQKFVDDYLLVGPGATPTKEDMANVKQSLQSMKDWGKKWMDGGAEDGLTFPKLTTVDHLIPNVNKYPDLKIDTNVDLGFSLFLGETSQQGFNGSPIDKDNGFATSMEWANDGGAPGGVSTWGGSGMSCIKIVLDEDNFSAVGGSNKHDAMVSALKSSNTLNIAEFNTKPRPGAQPGDFNNATLIMANASNMRDIWESTAMFVDEDLTFEDFWLKESLSAKNIFYPKDAQGDPSYVKKTSETLPPAPDGTPAQKRQKVCDDKACDWLIFGQPSDELEKEAFIDNAKYWITTQTDGPGDYLNTGLSDNEWANTADETGKSPLKYMSDALQNFANGVWSPTDEAVDNALLTAADEAAMPDGKPLAKGELDAIQKWIKAKQMLVGKEIALRPQSTSVSDTVMDALDDSVVQLSNKNWLSGLNDDGYPVSDRFNITRNFGTGTGISKSGVTVVTDDSAEKVYEAMVLLTLL